MRFGLIGEKLGHSFSKKVHAQLGYYPYELKEISRDELHSFLMAKEFEGINVTIPYKQEVIPYLDYVSPEVGAIGACNTIVNKDGKLYGYNTDAFGFESLLKKIGVSVNGKRCAILGSGGTSKTAAYVLNNLGAKSIIKVSRSGKDGTYTYKDMPHDIEIIVNTTPCGMYPDVDSSPIDVNELPSLIACIDVVYNPLRTRLVQGARKHGLISEAGLYMLVAQAVRASELFLGKKYRDEILDDVFVEVLAEQENIVLIGMPTSGKTTIGNLIARELGRDFYDVDSQIEREIGMSIPDYFSKYGEQSFRDVEEKVVADLSKMSGIVIATGGGSVLRESNVGRLKQNGRVFFLDRSLENLQAAANRPLSKDKDALKRRYEERYLIYREVADEIIDGNGSIEDVLNELKGKLR